METLVGVSAKILGFKGFEPKGCVRDSLDEELGRHAFEHEGID